MSSLGNITWHDLTVVDAEQVRDFYAAVVGWTHNACSMGNYNDYEMLNTSGQCVAGVCHAHGINAHIPPQWLMYVTVGNIAQSIEQCLALGGSIVDGPRTIGTQQCCIIRDPAGAILAIVSE